MGLADASDLVTDYLSAFGQEADQAGRMADVLAYAQANSNTTTQGLGDAFKNCAVNAYAFGLDIEQTTALLGKLGDQGLKNSEAGTALNAIFRDMSSKMKDGAIAIGDTSVKITDANGNFKSMAEIVAGVEKATDGLSESEKMVALQSTFTSDSIKAMGILMNTGADDIETFTNELYNSNGAASEMAETMNDNLSGQITSLGSALEAAGIAIGEALLPVIKPLVEWIQNLVNWFNNLSPGVQTAIAIFGLVVASIGPILLIVGQLCTAIGGLITFFGAGGVGAGILSAAIGALSGPVGIAIAIITGLIAIGVLLYKNWDTIKAKCSEIWSYICDSISKFVSNSTQWIKDKWEECKQWISNCWNNVKDTAINIWNSIGDFFTETIPQWINNITNWFNELPYKIGYALGYALGTIVQWGIDTWNYLTTNVPIWIENVVNWFSGLPGKIWTWLSNAIQKVAEWGAQTYQKAKDAASKTINAIIDWFKQLPGKIWTWLTQSIQKMIQWASNMVSKGREAASKTVESVVNGFKNLPSKIVTIGSNAVKSLWSGISSMAGWIKGKISGFINGIIDGFRGVASGISAAIGKRSIDLPDVEQNINLVEDQNYSQVKFDYARVRQANVSDFVAQNYSSLDKFKDFAKSVKVDNKDSNKIIQSDIHCHVSVENLNANNKHDVKQLAEELAFYIRRQHPLGARR